MTEQDDELDRHYVARLEDDEIVAAGPVLGLDIDGVCIPVDGIYDLSPPGFLCEPSIGMNGTPHWHPRLSEWLDRLDGAFARVHWSTSWGTAAGQFAYAVGSKRASGWKWASKLGDYTNPWSDGRVPPDVPVALVDDQFSARPAMLDWIARRSAPTLVVVPSQWIGLGEALVRHLCAFAADPESHGADRPLAMYSDPKLEWTGPTGDPAGWEAAGAGDLRPWQEADARLVPDWKMPPAKNDPPFDF